jgi:hypothetical protein
MSYKTKTRLSKTFSFVLMVALVFSSVVVAKTVVKVAKHVVKGSGVTPQQMEDQFKKYKAVWDSPQVEHKQVGGVDEVNNVDEGRVKGAINIYGTPRGAGPRGNAGICYDRRFIEIGPNCPNDTGAHEGGHWGGANPDDTNHPDNHGTPKGFYPIGPNSVDPNYSGYDTNGDGKADANDANNIMFPGTGRKGSNVDPNQRKRYEENMKKWAESQKATEAERGKELKDAKHDVPPPSDISETVVWGLGTNEMDYTLHFEVLMEPNLMPGIRVGFYLETDQSCTTGEPPEGLDYYVGYDTDVGETIFQKYEPAGGGWVTMPMGVVESELEYIHFDAPYPSIPLGVTLSVPLAALTPLSQNNLLSYKAVAQQLPSGPTDVSPNTGLATILTAPLPPEGILGDVDGDGDVDFEDFAYVAENWLFGK